MTTVVNVVLSYLITSLFVTSSCRGLKVIDLTYPLKEGESIAYPIYPQFNFTILTRAVSSITNGWLESNYIALAEHTGTHIDAPSHFARGHWRMHQIPASRLVGPGVVIDVTEQVKRNVDYGVTVEDLKNWEKRNGGIPEGAVVLMRSGWGSRYPDRRRVFNSQNPNDLSSHRYPGFSREAGEWLLGMRNITALGSDTPSPDVAIDKKFPIHKLLLAENVMILENVAHVDRLPESGSLVVLGALNIHDGSGSPTRILALTDIDSTFWNANGGVGGMPRMSVGCIVGLVLLFVVKQIV